MLLYLCPLALVITFGRGLRGKTSVIHATQQLAQGPQRRRRNVLFGVIGAVVVGVGVLVLGLIVPPADLHDYQSEDFYKTSAE